MKLETRVEQISAQIRQLREVAADGRKSRELIDSLFRSVHSLKAAASAEGLTELSRIAHEFENVLHSLRIGKVTLDGTVLQVFDDTVRALLGEAQTPVLDCLSELSSRDSARETFVSDEFLAHLKDEERHRAAAAIREGSNLYQMEAIFDASDFEQRFRDLKEKLSEVSEVISTEAKLDNDVIKFRVLYAAQRQKISVTEILRRLVRAGKSLAAALGKEIEFVVNSDELVLDKETGDKLSDALLHLIRNAVDHGIESRGKITVEVTTTAGQIQISVTDDGRGIDPANIPLLFQPGFSTATEVTEVSGRGVGLDAVKTAVKELGGSVRVTSAPARGSSFEITMPNPNHEA